MAQDTTGGSPTVPQSLTVAQAAEKFDAMLSEEEKGGSGEPQQATETTETTEQATDTDSPAEDPEAATEAVEEEVEDVEADEDSDEPAQIDPTQVLLKVKVGDEEQEITADEAAKGYMRQADYTRKTQELAAARKEFAEKELPAVRDERAQYAQLIGQLRQTLEQMTPKEPNWEQLRAEDPDRFAETWAAWDRREKQLASIRAEEQQAQARLAADQQQQFEAYLQEQAARLVEAIPELAVPEKAKPLKDSLVEYARGSGFTEEEISNVADHRSLLLLYKARLWDESQKRKQELPKAVQGVVKAVARPGGKPGAASSVKPREVTEITRAKQRLAKTGNVKDAANAIDLIMAASEKRRRR